MKLATGNLIGIVGGLLVIIGVVLPWASFENLGVPVNVSGIDAWIIGLPLLIFGVIGLVMTILGGKGPGIVGIVMGVLALLMALAGMAIVTWIVTLAGWSGTGITVSTGFGTYICIIGSILLIVGSAMVIGQKKAPPAPAPMAPPPAAPPAQ